MCRLFMITIQSPYPIVVFSVAKYRPHQGPILVTFGQICNFRDLNLVTFYFYELTRFFFKIEWTITRLFLSTVQTHWYVC